MPPADITPPGPKAAPTQDEIEVFIARRLSSQLGIRHEEVDLQQPFSALGLDSASALTFLGDLETWLDRRLSPTLFWNYPTVTALAKHLGDTGPDERKRTKWNP
jgi:acyl carrier protein